MVLYLAYDTATTMQFEIHAAKIDLLRATLGDIGAHYRCIIDEGVPIHANMRDFKGKTDDDGMKVTKVLGRVHKDEVIIANGQAIDFYGGSGPVARLHIKSKGVKGWCSYNHQGAFAQRYFVLVSTKNARGEESGTIHFKITRKNDNIHVTIMKCVELTEDEDLSTDRNAIFAMVRVNGFHKRTGYAWVVDTATKEPIKEPEWNGGTGETLVFPMVDEDLDDKADELESIVIKVYGSMGESAEKLQLRQELAKEDIGSLRKRAENDGVATRKIDIARDGHNPKHDLINLIFLEETAKMKAEQDTDDLIGILPVPIDEVMHGSTWELDHTSFEALSMHQELQDADDHHDGSTVAEMDDAHAKGHEPDTFSTLKHGTKAKRDWKRSQSGMLLGAGDTSDDTKVRSFSAHFPSLFLHSLVIWSCFGTRMCRKPRRS